MKNINTIGIVGAGTMGSALAQKFAQEGLSVILVDREDRFLEKGLKNINTTLKEGVDRRIFTEEKMAQILARITLTKDLNDLALCQVIIEAVFEDHRVKEKLFRRLSSIVSDQTILATNTSSFSVSDLSASVIHPERFLGLHFFYHAAKNRLVEIVKGDATADSVFQATLRFMQRCGKDPIVCRDAYGFVVNRFFVPWLNEAVRIYKEGLAGNAAIDAIARQTFGCGMGPFALMNATGVPIAYHAQKTLEEAYGKFYRPDELLSGQAKKNEPWEISSDEELNLSVSDEIAHRMLSVIFLICGQLMDEKVCTAGDINRGARIGLRWRKGPLDLFHKYGEKRVYDFVHTITDHWILTPPESLSPSDWQPDYIAVEKKVNTGTITINRPEGLNALNPEVVSQLSKAFTELNDDAPVDTIIITGRGKAFVAGADIKFFIDHIKRNTISEIVGFTSAGQRLFQRIEDSPKTVIAVINGLALGGGLELALSADIIVALETALLAFPETGIGIYPGLGGTQRTVTRVGKSLAKYLIYTGQMLTAKRANEIGLVDLVVTWDDLAGIMENPERIIKSPVRLTDEWRKIAQFFDKHTVAQFLGDSEFSEGWSGMIKKIKLKAPRALHFAEILINEQKGPDSELEYLEDIFQTEDALLGLQNAGRRPPKYKGC